MLISSKLHSRIYWFALMALCMLISACSETPKAAPSLMYRSVSQTPVEAPLSKPAAPSAPRPEAASPTASPTLTRTPAPSYTPSPVPSPTPTATPTLHPMNILAMRQTPYPGSDIIIHEQLDRG